MMNNKIALLTAAAALTQQVAGLSAHRHLHEALEKRALAAEKRVAELEARALVIKTDWVVVTKTVHWSPDMLVAAPTADPVPEAAPAAPAPVVVEVAPTTLAKVAAPEATAAAAPVAAVAEAEANVDPVPEVSKKAKKPKTEKKPAETPAASGNAFLGSKRGIAFNDAQLANTFGAACADCGWGHDWSSMRDDFDSKFNFVPTLWGPQPEHSQNWASNAQQMIDQGSKALFSFNEPDIASQCNLSPAQAAQDYVTYMNPFHGKALLGAPAVSNSGQPGQGLDWLQQWITECGDNCKFDFCNVHWYSEAQYADTLFEHLENAHKVCGGKPVVLSEFAPLDTGSAVDDFVSTVIPKLDQIEYLVGYSYFMVDSSHLMSGNTDLSSYGQIYATV
jgi:hypothetical protein